MSKRQIIYKIFILLPWIIPFLLGLGCQIALLFDPRQRRGYIAACVAGLVLSVSAAVVLEHTGHWHIDSRHWQIREALAFSAAVSMAFARARLGLILLILCVAMCAVLIAARFSVDYVAAGMLSGVLLTILPHGLRRVVLRAGAV